MIVKMQFVNITGPQEDIDRVMEQYLSRYEIQLEPALSELKTTENLRPFVEKNPYKDALLKTQEFISYLEHPDQITPDPALNKKAIFSRVHEIDLAYRELEEKEEIAVVQTGRSDQTVETAGSVPSSGLRLKPDLTFPIYQTPIWSDSHRVLPQD